MGDQSFRGLALPSLEPESNLPVVDLNSRNNDY